MFHSLSLEALLACAGALALRVRDSNAARLSWRRLLRAQPPVAGVWIHARPMPTRLAKGTPGIGSGMLSRGIYQPETDAEGRFAFSELDPGAYCVAVADPRWTRDARENTFVLPIAVPPELSFPVAPLGSLDGLATGSDGAPAPGAHVSVQYRGSSRLPAAYGSDATRSKPDGRFRFEGMLPGVYQANVRTSKLRPADREGIIVRFGATTAGADLHMAPGMILRG